jgi:hypothetical protein
MRGTIEQRFWNKVDRSGSCWIWNGKKNRKGYGVQHIGSYKCMSSILAHRLSWILSTREDVPEGLFVLHRCDNPPCVNPDHLFLGTLDDNNQDCKNKLRHTWGTRHPQAKLSESDVSRIKDIWAFGELTQPEIGSMFGIGSRAVSKIVTGVRWGWVA